jgi:hypothetical protein
VAPPSATAIACTSVADSLESDPMPPTLPLIAFWMRVTVAPFLLDVARAPWHPAQFDA